MMMNVASQVPRVHAPVVPPAVGLDRQAPGTSAAIATTDAAVDPSTPAAAPATVLPTTSPAVATPPADAAINNEERQATIAQLRSLRSKYGTQLLELDRQAGPLLAEFNAVSKASDTPGPSEATGSGAEGAGSKLRLHPPKAYSDECKAQRRMSAVFLDDVARYAKHPGVHLSRLLEGGGTG
jgi:hypothetical protein